MRARVTLVIFVRKMYIEVRGLDVYGQLRTAHAMPEPYYRARHLITLQIDQMQKIAGVVEPAGCTR